MADYSAANGVVKDNKLSTKEKLFLTFCWIVAFLINVKICFVAYCTDSTYTVLMGYRLISGDRPFVEMLDAHLTSSFIPAILEYIFYRMTGSYEGVVLWLHFCGMFIFLGIAIGLIALLRQHFSIKTLNYMALIFFVLKPKMVNLPDYANLSVAFSVLMWAFLLKYSYSKKRTYLIIASIIACVAAMAYPSNLLFFIIIVGLTYLVNGKRVKECLWAVVVYGLFFGSFLAYVLIAGKMNLMELLASCKLIVTSDGHSQFRYSGWPFLKFTVYAAAICLAVFAVSLLISRLTGKKVSSLYAWILLIAGNATSSIWYIVSKHNGSSFEWIYLFFAFSFSTIFIGIGAYRKSRLSAEQRTAYILGLIISGGTLLNTLILTDLTLITILCYSSLGIMVSLIPLYENGIESSLQRKHSDIYAVAISVFFVICFHQFFLCGDASGDIRIITDIENYERVGPEKYLVSTLSYCNRIKEGYFEMVDNVTSDDALLVISERRLYDLIAYMYTDAKISNYTVVSQPQYYETPMLEYWERFPDRKPTVIAVPCWNDEETRGCPQWLSDYIDDNYELNYAGMRWKLYR